VAITSFISQVFCTPVVDHSSGDISEATSAGLNSVNNEKTRNTIPIIGIVKTRVNFNFGFIMK
jgi:hypothetical protein